MKKKEMKFIRKIQTPMRTMRNKSIFHAIQMQTIETITTTVTYK